MIAKNVKTMVEKATVTLLSKGGLGVLVRNNLILTAAHCVDFSCSGTMALGDCFIGKVRTTQGKLKAAPYAVEPVSDIAVLGSLDGQVYYEESVRFQDFCEKTEPIPLCLKELRQYDGFPIWVYTHKKKWITGKAVRYSLKKNEPTIGLEMNEGIEGGTSGGPVINEQGELVAIVSISGGTIGEPNLEGRGVRPNLALPVWVYQEISVSNPHSLYDSVTKERAKVFLKKMKAANSE